MNNFNLYYKIFELGIDDTMRQDTTAHGVKQQAVIMVIIIMWCCRYFVPGE